MMFSENIRIGIAAVRKARFRSMVTVLGIIIGIVSVVTIVSLGEGVKRQVTGQVADLGSNLITVRPGRLVNRDAAGNISSVNLFASTGIASLTESDVDSIRKLPDVKAAAAIGTFSALPKFNGSEFNDGIILVTSPELVSTIDHKVEFGSFFAGQDTTSRTVVIGAGVAQKLFKETVPIGKSLEIRGQNFTVQGVFAPFRDSPIDSGINFNNAVFLSEAMAGRLAGSKIPAYEILVKTGSEASIPSVATSINKTLKDNHGGQDDFTVLKPDEVSAASDELLSFLTRLIGAMAAITLLVGGVGIMNVMLVSVSERTNEIGIRKAIGATNRQIRSQFVIEAAILSVWGAFWAVVAVGAVNLGIRIFSDLEPVLTWQPIVIASGISILVGVLFGVIPAVKASRKDPIESLRPN